jgi:hypothetical protein
MLLFFHHEGTNDCMDAGGKTPRMGEVESRREQRSRATQGAVAENTEAQYKLRIRPVFVAL